LQKRLGRERQLVTLLLATYIDQLAGGYGKGELLYMRDP